MARPDHLICLECEAEVADFVWRDGEIRRATCEVCGNGDADAFSLPEEFDQAIDEDSELEEDNEEEDDEEDKHLDDYDDFEDQDQDDQ